jgi:hypothetical protein
VDTVFALPQSSFRRLLALPVWLFPGSGVLGDRGEAGGSEGPLME